MDEATISRVPLFAGLPPAEIVHLAATLRRGSYPANTVLFCEGERGDRFYVVLAGQVAVVKALGTPDERVLAVRGPGEFLGEMSLLSTDGLRTASVRTMQDVQLLEMTRAEFDSLLYRNPGLAYDMLRVLNVRLRDSQEAAMQDLRERNRQLAQAYADLQAAQGQLIEQEALARELRLATEIQMSMLPASIPHLRGFDIAARMVPAKAVGGDFFDVFLLDRDRLAVVIGDVSGKGVPAALFMALTSTLLRAEARRVASPEEVLSNVNRYLLARNTKGMFVTALYGVLYRVTHDFSYVRAGHEFPLLCGPAGAIAVPENALSLPLGVFPRLQLDAQTIALPPDSTLLLYTDGITEAEGEGEELFGLERLAKTVCERWGEPAAALCDHIVEAAIAYSDPAPQSDDITLVAVRALPRK